MTTYPNNRERESFHVRTQGTKVGPEEGGQHVDPLVYQVHCRPTSRGLAVHGSVRMDKMRHIRDIYPSHQYSDLGSRQDGLTDTGLDVPIGETARMECVVDILAT